MEKRKVFEEYNKTHNPKYLLTMDYTPITSYNGIKQINVLEWLMK